MWHESPNVGRLPSRAAKWFAACVAFLWVAWDAVVVVCYGVRATIACVLWESMAAAPALSGAIVAAITMVVLCLMVPDGPWIDECPWDDFDGNDPLWMQRERGEHAESGELDDREGMIADDDTVYR